MTPSPAQLEVLRLLAGGLRLYKPERTSTRYLLRLRRGEHAVRAVAESTVTPMITAGWLTDCGLRYELAPAGQRLVDVGAHVRAFAEGM